MDPHSAARSEQPTVFLLDAASALEDRVLREWVEEQRADPERGTGVRCVRIASSRRPRGSRSAALEAVLASGEDAVLAPLRVAWLAPDRGGRREASPWDLVTSTDPRDPGWLRAHWIRRRAPDRCRVVAGEPAPITVLRERWQQAVGSNVAETVGLPSFVERQAALALDRAERRLRGGRYKIPRFVREEVLARPVFEAGLARLAREQDRPVATVRREAARYLREIAATHSPLWIDVFARVCRSGSTRGYEDAADRAGGDRGGPGSVAAAPGGPAADPQVEPRPSGRLPGAPRARACRPATRRAATT